MIEKIKKKLSDENAAVQIVEASFVFPIMFIILFFLIYMGNAFYLKSQVEAITEKYAIEGASYCADPLLATMKEQGKVPSLKDLKTKPYRYIFGGMSEIEDKIQGEIQNELDNNITSFFKNMNPTFSVGAKPASFDNKIFYSTFSVQIDYSITMPIRYLGAESPPILTISSRAEVPVNDTAEFIRNTDMVIDLFSGTKAGQKISEFFGKINDFLGNFAGKGDD